MHPILSNRRALFLYLTVWFFVCSLVEFPFFFYQKAEWTAKLAGDIPLLLLYAFICLSSYYLCRMFPVKTTPWYVLLMFFFTAAGFAACIMFAAGFGWIRIVDSFGISSPIMILYQPWRVFIISVLALIFLLSVAFHYVIIGLEQFRETERQTFELKLLAQEAELRALRAQIDPHFLFNSLNSINSLMTADPERARAMVVRLGDFFRKSLELGGQKLIPLSEELGLIENYLSIEQLRFGSRLHLVTEIDPGTPLIPVPPLILQPLVENAIRHGISQMLDGGTITLKTVLKNENVVISVCNEVDPDYLPVKGTGLGIKNVRLRIETLFEQEGKFMIEKEKQQFTSILVIPLRRKDPQ